MVRSSLISTTKQEENILNHQLTYRQETLMVRSNLYLDYECEAPVLL